MKNYIAPLFLLSVTCVPRSSIPSQEKVTGFLETISHLEVFKEKPLVYGEKIDSFNGVDVFYNGGMNNVSGRNLSSDGYNLGLKYQCVEFVKRYYYHELKHKMPNSWGHAKDFFDSNIGDGKINTERGLLQFVNGSNFKPAVNDILVFDKTDSNPFGHVAIISNVQKESVEVIQQNVGGRSDTREAFKISTKNKKWWIDSDTVLGWLRKQ